MKEPTDRPIPIGGPKSGAAISLLVAAPVKLTVAPAHAAHGAETTCSTGDDDAAARLGYRRVLRCSVRS